MRPPGPWARRRAGHRRAPDQAAVHRSEGPRHRRRDSRLAGVRPPFRRFVPLAEAAPVRRDLAPAIPLIVLAWTNPLHHLYWAQLSNELVGGSLIAIRSFGPGFWATVAYCYVLVAISIFLLARAVHRFTGVYRIQAAVMLFGVILPWAIEIIDMARMIPFIPIDLVSTTFVVTGLTFLPALFRFHLLDLPQVAWAIVIQGINDPVVVIDSRGRIVELNPAAQRCSAGNRTRPLGPLQPGRSPGGPHWPIGCRESKGVTRVSRLTGPMLIWPPRTIRRSRRWATMRGPAVGSWFCATSRS